MSDDYKFVRLETPDSYGISRGIQVTRRHFKKSQSFSLVIAAANGLTPSSAIVDGSGVQSSIGFRDAFFYPDLTTFKVLPWSPETATVLADYRIAANDESSEYVPTCSRGILKKAVNELKKIGLSIYGAYEYEFHLYNQATGKQVFDESCVMVTSVQSTLETLTKDLMNNLEECGIFAETCHLELGGGQLEITLEPKYGVTIADDALRYKQIVKDICNKHGYFASFMSKINSTAEGSSAHLNHSLWNMEGANVFYDENSDDKLSHIAKHWLAGLQYHAKALCCLSASTPNCYERLQSPFSPKTNVWGFDNRTVCYRVKNIDKSKTYIENRLPGAACNQHISLAALIYAGMDGIKRKLELKQKPYCGDATTLKDDGTCPVGIDFLPRSLLEGLASVNENEMLKKALGEKFIKLLNVTRNYEISEYEEAKRNGKQWEWHKEQYFKYV